VGGLGNREYAKIAMGNTGIRLIKTATSKSKRIAAEHTQSREELEAALAFVTDAVITADVLDCITYMNPAAQSLTGWPFSDAAGKPLTKVFSIASTDGATGTSETDPLARHAVLVGDAAAPIVIEYSMTPTRDAGGVLTGTVVVFRDVSRRHAAELALQSSEETIMANTEALFAEKERAQVTLKSIGDAVISTDFRGRVSFLNIVAEKMTGWTQDDAAGRSLDEIFALIDTSTRERIACPTMQAIIEDRTVGIDAACVLIRRDGVEVAIEASASPIHDKHGGVAGAVMVAHDVTAARDLSIKLARLALHDNLTGLPNRNLFSDRLHQALVRAQRNVNWVALLFIDLDQFKPVNDSLGHAIGDKLLQAVAQRLLTCVRSSDTVGRFGGDEFVILLADVAHAEDAEICADKVLEEIKTPYQIAGHKLDISASIGIACFPEDATESDTLLKYADIAMYQAKYAGRNDYQRFRPAMISDEVQQKKAAGKS
jgi:diguanylate cyclase (GGDEF)-like protein/PAS domain S-box-containing protein